MCSNCGDSDKAADALYTDIANAKNEGVYYTPSDEDTLTVIMATVDTDDKHGHYLGFKDVESGKVLVMIKFDCVSYHNFLTSANSLDGLNDNIITQAIENLFGTQNFN